MLDFCRLEPQLPLGSTPQMGVVLTSLIMANCSFHVCQQNSGMSFEVYESSKTKSPVYIGRVFRQSGSAVKFWGPCGQLAKMEKTDDAALHGTTSWLEDPGTCRHGMLCILNVAKYLHGFVH